VVYYSSVNFFHFSSKYLFLCDIVLFYYFDKLFTNIVTIILAVRLGTPIAQLAAPQAPEED